MYKINTKIPGWNSSQILDVISAYASNVPDNGNILELGALFGRSTYSLGHNKRDSVRLTVIDIWSRILLSNHTEVNYHDGRAGVTELALLSSKLRPNPGRLESIDFVDLHKSYVGDIVNAEFIQGLTSMDNENFPMFDFIFHDAGHSYEDVYADLVHWFPKLKVEGNLILDDYDTHNFPDLIRAVDKFVEENDLYTEMVTGRNILLRRK